MHDEDCAIGLEVSNKRGDKWTAFGDKRLLDKVNETNLKYCREAIQASADEVCEAWKHPEGEMKKIKPEDYQALKIAPTVESARAIDQKFVPLFAFAEKYENLERRVDVNNRRKREFTRHWKTVDTGGGTVGMQWKSENLMKAVESFEKEREDDRNRSKSKPDPVKQ